MGLDCTRRDLLLISDIPSYVQTAGVTDAKVKFDVVDFFASEESAAYDLIYDYTYVRPYSPDRFPCGRG